MSCLVSVRVPQKMWKQVRRNRFQTSLRKLPSGRQTSFYYYYTKYLKGEERITKPVILELLREGDKNVTNTLIEILF